MIKNETLASSQLAKSITSAHKIERAANDGNLSRGGLTDAQRHDRFLAMAKEVGADESADSFDLAFATVATPKPKG